MVINLILQWRLGIFPVCIEFICRYIGVEQYVYSSQMPLLKFLVIADLKAINLPFHIFCNCSMLALFNHVFKVPVPMVMVRIFEEKKYSSISIMQRIINHLIL